MPEGRRFTSVGTAAVPRSPAHDMVNRASARQTPRFALDITFFDRDVSPMMKDTTELMTIIGAVMFLIIALLFHITAMVSVIGALMMVIIVLMHHFIPVMSVMIGPTTDITRVVSVIIRMMWLTSGMMSLSKKVLSVIIATDRDVSWRAPRSPALETPDERRAVLHLFHIACMSAEDRWRFVDGRRARRRNRMAPDVRDVGPPGGLVAGSDRSTHGSRAMGDRYTRAAGTLEELREVPFPNLAIAIPEVRAVLSRANAPQDGPSKRTDAAPVATHEATGAPESAPPVGHLPSESDSKDGEDSAVTSENDSGVRRRGLEPLRCYPLAPQASASANSATFASGRA